MFRKLLPLLALLVGLSAPPALAEPDGLHGSVSVPALGIEADLGWSWNYPEFCPGCGWNDATFWPTHSTLGFHAPNWNVLYKTEPMMIFQIHGVYTWQWKDYIVESVEIVNEDYLLAVPEGSRIQVVICYPDRPWPQRVLIHLVELTEADFYNRLNNHWRNL
jgi:hypothetical protein